MDLSSDWIHLIHAVSRLFFLAVLGMLLFWDDDEDSKEERPKIYLFHQKSSKDGYENVITGAYQLDIESGQLRFAGSSYSKRTKSCLQKLINELDPISLTYLKEKEQLEKELNNPKSWRRDEHTEKALNRLSEKPFVLNFGNSCGLKDDEKLDYYQYRRLEEFLGNCLKNFGMSRKPSGSNDPMNDPKFVAHLSDNTIFKISTDSASFGDAVEDPEAIESPKSPAAPAAVEVKCFEGLNEDSVLLSIFVFGIVVLVGLVLTDIYSC